MNEFHAWLWRINRKGTSVTDLSEMTGYSREKVKEFIDAHRWERGEVVMSREQLTQAYVIEGKSIRVIAEMLWCSKDAVHRHLKQYGIRRASVCALSQNSNNVGHEHEQRITALREKNIEKYYAWKDEWGDRQPNRYTRPPDADEQLAEMAEMAEYEWSYKEIGGVFCLSADAVAKRLSRAGMTPTLT